MNQRICSCPIPADEHAHIRAEDVLVMNKEGQQRSLRRKGDLDVMEAGLHSLSFDLHCQIGHEVCGRASFAVT
eukprot:1158541-Pelagomonas_calceolata.AAC.1